MNQTLHSYNAGKYFGTAARVFGWVATGIALLAVLGGSVVAWLVLPAGVITQLTHYRTEFDLQHMTYREGVSLAGYTFGKMQPLQGFDFLFLKKNRYSQLMESRASMASREMEKFDGYIQLAGGVKLHLLQRAEKETALQEMQQIASDLNTELRDLTEMRYY